MYLSLKPNYYLRKAEKGILFFKMDEKTGFLEDQRILHPNIAIMLALFNGKRNINEIKNVITYLFNLSESKAKEYLNELLDAWKPFLWEAPTGKNTQVEEYNPKDFIIHSGEVDLKHYRLASPLNLSYIVTYSCSRNCIYCYSKKEANPFDSLLPFTRIKEIIREAALLGVLNISFTGGDPFQRSDFLDILDFTIASSVL